jgi:hypothetical protein
MKKLFYFLVIMAAGQQLKAHQRVSRLNPTDTTKKVLDYPLLNPKSDSSLSKWLVPQMKINGMLQPGETNSLPALTYSNFDHMPILKPQGNYHMPVLKLNNSSNMPMINPNPGVNAEEKKR